VFVRSAGVWSEEQKLTAGDGAGDDWFGYSVSVSGDTVLVGAYRDDDNGSNSGSAYVFVRSAGVWSQEQKLTAGDGAVGDWFGYSVSVSGDTALVGAYLDDEPTTWGNPSANQGSVYIFRLTDDVDTDGDGLSDDAETNTHGTDPNVPDSDDDGLNDGDEVNIHGTDPNVPDSDGDGVNDGDEINLFGSNPNLSDSDEDGYLDKTEVDEGTDAANAAEMPSMNVRMSTARKLSFYSKLGVDYQVEASETGAVWEVVPDTLVTGTGELLSITVIESSLNLRIVEVP
jgi:hypothetical protein